MLRKRLRRVIGSVRVIRRLGGSCTGDVTKLRVRDSVGFRDCEVVVMVVALLRASLPADTVTEAAAELGAVKEEW